MVALGLEFIFIWNSELDLEEDKSVEKWLGDVAFERSTSINAPKQTLRYM